MPRDSRQHRMLLIAHRGASAVAPESTAAAIQAARDAGADAVELDVQMTRDGRLVAFHDERVDRTTSGTGRLRQLSYRELTRLDAGSWFAPRFRGQRVLLVSQAVRIGAPRLRFNLELKRTPKPQALLRRLTRLIARQHLRSRLLISSFDPRLLQLLRSSGLARALICRRQPDRALAHAIRLGCIAWHPHRSLVTSSRVARAHAAGLRVHPWTVDDRRSARRMLRMGVDGLFTNDPARLARMRRQATRRREDGRA